MNKQEEQKSAVYFTLEIRNLTQKYINDLNKISDCVTLELENLEPENNPHELVETLNLCFLNEFKDKTKEEKELLLKREASYSKRIFLEKSLNEIIDILNHFDSYKKKYEKSIKINNLFALFSKREQEVIKLLLNDDMSAPKIADMLCISIRTVERHIENIAKKIQNDELLIGILATLAEKYSAKPVIKEDSNTLRDPQKMIKLLFKLIENS